MFEGIPEITLNFDDINLEGEILVKDIYYIARIMTWLTNNVTLQQIGMLKIHQFFI